MKKNEIKRHLIAYSFIAPNFIGFGVFTLVPIITAFLMAFVSWNGARLENITFVGIKNFQKLFYDTNFKTALLNTIIYAAGTVPLTVISSLSLAIILNKKIIGRNFFRSVSFFPYVASLVAVAVVWNMIFNPARGPINMMLMKFGVSELSLPGWAADKNWAMLTVIFFSVWKGMGYYMIIYLAGIQGINPELYEAAELDGATNSQQLWHITIPQLSATTFFVVVMLTISSFKVYDQVYMLTQGGPGTSTLVLVYHIYNTAFISWELGYASAVAMVLFLLVLTVTLIQFKSEQKFYS